MAELTSADAHLSHTPQLGRLTLRAQLHSQLRFQRVQLATLLNNEANSAWEGCQLSRPASSVIDA